jgi:pyrimidine 5'-nucleotidase
MRRTGILPAMRDTISTEDVIPIDGPDPDRVETWIFDLDNTLYPASSDLFAQVNARIRAFIAAALAIDETEASSVQSRYFAAYRSSLRGLILHHDVEPRRFLDYVHDIDLSPIGPDPALRAAIEALSGRKVIFTNGSTNHARQVLRQLDLEALFEDIFDIEAADYLPKPYPQTYHQLIARNVDRQKRDRARAQRSAGGYGHQSGARGRARHDHGVGPGSRASRCGASAPGLRSSRGMRPHRMASIAAGVSVVGPGRAMLR